ncbi:MAG: deoxyribose-phosphate aldolase [Microbacteriaceae bacterium]|nr:deoxyribose-phosphate aldolase [Microbacteriaceae bacterium]NBS62415.1 deoxyribose-phosphate aldolase [Microbacteriaceae bacterium]
MSSYRGYTQKQIVSLIDHTLLKPEATKSDLEACIKTALEAEVVAMCIRPMDVAYSAKALAGSDVRLCTVIGFPHGTVTTHTKFQETIEAVSNGAIEVDMVMNLGLFASGEYDLVEQDIASVVKAAKNTNPNAEVKVILETCLWNKDQIIKACQLCENAGAGFVKTSTGFAASGATVEAIRTMRATVGDRLGVKASGGIRTLDALIDMAEAGASRVGASGTTAILLEFAEKSN